MISYDLPVPGLSGSATGATTGSPILDTVTLSDSSTAAPGGTLTFALYGPGDPTCAGPAVATSVTPVSGSGSYTSDPFTPSTAGAYHWTATYSGDDLHAPAALACGAPGQTSTVTAATVPTPAPVSPVAAQCDGLAVTIQAVPGVPTIGTAGPDVIRGTDGDDEIRGLRGDDVVCGLQGDDTIRGGRGDDLLRGGRGADLLVGGRGDDRTVGGRGDDSVR